LIPGLWELTDYTINAVRLNLPDDPTPTQPIVNPNTIDVIWSYQNAARIDKPYIVLDYTTNDIPDHEYYSPVDAPGFRTMASWRKATVDMQFYCGTDSLKIASWLASMFSSERVLNKEMDLNVSVGTRLFLSRVPAMINTSQYEERAIYQFDFYYTEEIEEWVSWIATVELTGRYSGSPSDPLGDGSGLAGEGGLVCEETIILSDITNWDEWTTGWDMGRTVWDYTGAL
jgi:hypothetical protein